MRPYIRKPRTAFRIIAALSICFLLLLSINVRRLRTRHLLRQGLNSVRKILFSKTLVQKEIMVSCLSEVIGASHRVENLRKFNLRHSARQEMAIPEWQRSILHEVQRRRHFLVEVLQVRIYDNDKARWTVRELKQWIHYMFWAGIEHIYLCDHFRETKEQLDQPLRRYIELGLISYLPWNQTRDPIAAQTECYRNIAERYGHLTEWHISVDMDEYPYVSSDFAEGFLARYLHKQKSSIYAVFLHNYLMLGQGDRTKDMTIERINRITPEKANKLDKPIYRPSLTVPNVHSVDMKDEDSSVTYAMDADDDEIKLVHYWGSRTQNWGPDTPETISKTIEFNDVSINLAPSIRLSLLKFGECDAFNSTTGP